MTVRGFRYLLVCAVIGLLPAVLAAQGGGKVPEITAASASADGTTLFLIGSGFTSSMTITQAGIPLSSVVVDAGGAQATALVAATIPGTYQLIATAGKKSSAPFEFTIQSPSGATGPAGPTGAQGPVGQEVALLAAAGRHRSVPTGHPCRHREPLSARRPPRAPLLATAA